MNKIHYQTKKLKNKNRIFYVESGEFEESVDYDLDNCKKSLLYYQACMCECEAKLFYEATTRLSYELYVAKDIVEVKQIIEAISCLFSASALKQNALAEVIKSFNKI